MSRAALLTAVLALAPALPPACAKMLGKGGDTAGGGGPTATATAATAGTTSTNAGTAAPTLTAPPIYTAPEAYTAPNAATVGADAGASDFDRATAAWAAHDAKKVRALLEKKVRAGKGTQEEAKLVLQACLAASPRDKACVDAVKAKYPSVTP